jgi:hypothetical protein
MQNANGVPSLRPGLREALPWVTPTIHQLKELNLDAAVEQRRREDAKAENTARLVFSLAPEDFTWQVNPNHHRARGPPALFFAS